MKSSKQQAIELAYGEYWEEMKPFVNDNGWFDKNSFYNNQFSFKYEDLDLLFSHKEDYMIPKSIENIETNNGWISILSEKDLPSETNNYWVLNKLGISMRGYDMEEHNHWEDITHYQPITKPEPPIF